MSKAYLDPEEVRRLEEQSSYLRDKVLIRLLFHLGCRISEALALEVKDIDFKASTVSIRHLKSRVKLACPTCGAGLGKRHIYCPKCGVRVAEAVAKAEEHKKLRTLPLDRDTLEMLRDYVGRGGAIRQDNRDLIFGISRHRAWQIVKECAEKAKLPKLVNSESGKTHNVSPHRLRDAFATHAVKLDDSGDGLRLLQEHLGHASFNTTAKYRKVAGEELKDWYDKLWHEEVKEGGAKT
ncbi:MAG: tyrosine-type recombinase/integrase [Dehalococcoidia bacterium]|nr:tyrosine-type recombinase/integrase [Dehalococcoidia bacterium]